MTTHILHPGPGRGLLLNAAGAVIGLAVAGYGLFTAKDTQTAIIPPEDVALVNNRPILVADYETQLQTLYGISPAEATPGQRQRVVHDMIREELFVQRGLEIDEPSVDPDVRTALVNAVDQETAADAMSRTPTDKQLQDFYQQRKDRYSTEGVMLVRDLVPANGAAIPAEAAQALRRGLALPAALQRFGLKDSGRVKGEEFYFAARIHLGDALYPAAIALDDGGIADPLMVDGVPHLLAMEHNRRPVVLSFEAAHAEILGDYLKEQARQAQAGEESFLSKRAAIRIAAEYQK